MTLEISGKIIKILAEQTGTGKFGQWNKQEFVIETDDQYPKKICFSAWGDKADALKNVFQGDMVKVSFNPESREFNERWYTELRAWKIEKENSEAGSNALPDELPPFSEDDIPPEEENDLPF